MTFMLRSTLACRWEQFLFRPHEESEGDDPLRVFEPERFSRREVNAALKLEFSGLARG